MEKQELSQLSEDQLLEWFFENARVSPRIDGNDTYFVRVGTKILRAKDTDVLFGLVKNEVKNG